MEYALLRMFIPEEWREIFVAELSALGFDMMQETEEGLEASIGSDRKQEFETPVSDLLDKYAQVEGLRAEWTRLESVNWNEEWEKNYEPVKVEDRLLIRADFHPADPGVEYELVINPRMSFGTGHHATTWLMADAMLKNDLNGKSVMDAGCGTGVLAILAEKMGASRVMAYDISQLCVDNTRENAESNGCELIELSTGVLAELAVEERFDLVLANINKNALLDEMHDLCKVLEKDGTLFLSGFFKYDSGDLVEKASTLGLKTVYKADRNNWCVLGLRAG